ncbi:MAG TPA: hypothetical protein VFW11_00430 [Cyclobacteriaceae bacterium]|nr:hypothetical protein [Cyclobacteriaceae bacterium]
MKGLTKILDSKLLLVGLFSFAAVVANAQIYVSKGVQKYANKTAYESSQNEQTKLRSVETPAIALSKGVHKIGDEGENTSKGNIVSKGYPYWTIAKGIPHHHLRNQNNSYLTRSK